MLRSLLCFFLLLNCLIEAKSAVIPYQNDLRPELQQLYIQMEDVARSDARAALPLALEIYQKSNRADLNVSGWALVNYSRLLLDNDSIQKAKNLLSDSTQINWAKADSWLQVYHSLALGSALSFEGKYVNADKLFRAALSDKSDEMLQIHATQALASNLRYQGKIDQSLVKWYEALEMSESIPDSTLIYNCYLGLGIGHFLRDELEKSESEIQTYRKFNLRIKNRKNLAQALSILGLLKYRQREYQSSIDLNLEGYSIRKAINDIKGQGESLNNLALGYMGMKNWQQALRYLEEAVQLKTIANDHTQMTVILNNMGHCYNRLGSTEKAFDYFNLALTKGIENGQMGDVVNSYKNLIELHVRSKDYEKAFSAQTKLLFLKDSLAEIERIEAIDELEVLYETDAKEREIDLLQKERTIITNRWLTLALGLFLAIIIGVLFIDNQKRKHRQEKQLLTAEDELQKAELKIMTDLLEYNQTKLNLYTENLLRKNELVGQLELQLKDSVQHSKVETESGKELIQNFSAIRILTDDDWDEFKTLFNNVHKGMLDRLLSEHEQLTLGEQRLFLLMKLNLSTREIANILGVSPESIKKGRYRLKKKLNLSEDKTLQDFVIEF